MPESHKVKAIKMLHKQTEEKTYRGNTVISLCKAKSLCKHGVLTRFIQLQKAGSGGEVLIACTAQIQLHLLLLGSPGAEQVNF